MVVGVVSLVATQGGDGGVSVKHGGTRMRLGQGRGTGIGCVGRGSGRSLRGRQLLLLSRLFLGDGGLGVGERWVVVVGGAWVGWAVLHAGQTGHAGDAGGLAMLTQQGRRLVGRQLEMGVVKIHIVDELVKNLVQHDTPLTKPHQHQGQLEGYSWVQAELALAMRLMDGVLEKELYVGQGPVARAVGGDTHNRGLDKVVEAAEEVAEHPAGPDYPHRRVGEPTLQEEEGVLQTPVLPLAYLLKLGLHLGLQILQRKRYVCVVLEIVSAKAS